MKIIITGKDSQIGNKIEFWLRNSDKSKDYQVEQLDVITDQWKTFDFTGVDVVIHVAAIVHRPDCTDWKLYERVNVQLPVDIANKAKQSGVKQFVFMSSMAIFGIGKKLSQNIIDDQTIPMPLTMYGKSKFLAEKELDKLNDNYFHVTIVRPPNVYGGTRNDYIRKIGGFVKYLPIIPVAYTEVRQSMIYIDNLTELIRLLITENRQGVFMPQDTEAINTVELITTIKQAQGQPVRYSKSLGYLVRLLSFIPLVEKLYGGVMYSERISNIDGLNYNVLSYDKALSKYFALIKQESER